MTSLTFIRFLDICFSIAGLILTFPLMAVIFFLGFFDTGSPIFRQRRVGKNLTPFTLMKFRTMNMDAQSVATHMADAASISKLGHVLRRTKLDELPQLWNVLKGDMSLVGPRPCLFNQEELIQERNSRNVFNVKPGITGLAQIQSVDMSNPALLAEIDEEMINKFSVRKYMNYILLTLIGKGSGDRV